MKALLADIGGPARLLFDVLVFMARGKRERGAVARQMYAFGNRSAFFLSVTMGFIGAILVFQAGMQIERLLPEYSLLGAFFMKFLVRDLAASIGAIPLATRIGAGMAAELGTMVVTEQVDALRMSAAEPVDYLVVPRFIASTVMTVVLVIWSAFVAILAGLLTANVAFGISYETFLSFQMVTPGDLITGLTKAVAYGAAIPIVSCYRGLRTFGGAEGVGRSTTEAVVHSTVAIIALNFLISTASFLLFPE
jgi:phospholipid/cholesterol/gamma-HCH transport system permease protein